MATMQSKNDPSQRKRKQNIGQKMYNGKPIKPVLYIYRDGLKRYKYMAAQYNDESIIEDKDGNPIRWNQIQ